MKCLFGLLLAAGLGLTCLKSPVVAQTTQPAAEQSNAESSVPQPSAPQPSAPAEIEPEAADLISKVKSAYGNLTALTVAGKVSGNFDVAGQKRQEEQDFSGSFAAPNKFRHESKDGVILGSTGEKLYVYLPSENVYSTTDASKDRLPRVPQPMGNMLFGENPSLLMAISQDPAQMLQGATVKRVEDVTVESKPHAALQVSRERDDLTLLFDPSSHLLRRMTMDLRKTVEQRGAPDVKTAEFVVDYTTTTTSEAAPQPEQFAWSAPEGARDAAASAQAAGGRTFDAKTQLVGKPAPDFALNDLAGQEVKLSDAKGSVILLDFWATWCPPCVEGMPNLERIHKERGKDGVKVFAINAMEEKDKVAAFITQRNLTLPVLLDLDGKVGEAYEVEGWPTSVVIKRDGTIHKVLHPVGPEGEKALEEALNEAVKEQ